MSDMCEGLAAVSLFFRLARQELPDEVSLDPAYKPDEDVEADDPLGYLYELVSAAFELYTCILRVVHKVRVHAPAVTETCQLG